MPDYKELFYQSQAELADIEEELKRIVLKIKNNIICQKLSQLII